MKLGVRKLWLLSSICFLFAGIMSLINKDFVKAVMFLFLGVTYFVLSRNNYKGTKKTNL